MHSLILVISYNISKRVYIFVLTNVEASKIPTKS